MNYLVYFPPIFLMVVFEVTKEHSITILLFRMLILISYGIYSLLTAYIEHWCSGFILVNALVCAVAATLRSQSDTKAIRVEPISNIVKSLGAISCDSCEGKLASYDVYIDSGIANVSFLKRYCPKCLQMISQ